jgi:hypothetical protein
MYSLYNKYQLSDLLTEGCKRRYCVLALAGPEKRELSISGVWRVDAQRLHVFELGTISV